MATGKVYEGVANTLKHLSVEKNGVLPGNMAVSNQRRKNV